MVFPQWRYDPQMVMAWKCGPNMAVWHFQMQSKTWTHSLTHFIQQMSVGHVLCILCMAGTVLGAGSFMVSKTDKILAFVKLTF